MGMSVKSVAVLCEICGTVGTVVDSIYFPNSDTAEISMVHGQCVRTEVKSGTLRIVQGRVIESLELYCRHFGNRTMPNKIGDDEDA